MSTTNLPDKTAVLEILADQTRHARGQTTARQRPKTHSARHSTPPATNVTDNAVIVNCDTFANVSYAHHLIDNTAAHWLKNPIWANIICSFLNGTPIAAIIDQPDMAHTTWITPSQITQTHTPQNPTPPQTITPQHSTPTNTDKQASPAKCSAQDQLAGAIFAAPDPETLTPAELGAYRLLRQPCAHTLLDQHASAYLAFAAGKIDMIIDVRPSPALLGAALLIGNAAAGQITDWRGQPATMASTQILLASTPKLSREAVSVLHRAAEL